MQEDQMVVISVLLVAVCGSLSRRLNFNFKQYFFLKIFFYYFQVQEVLMVVISVLLVAVFGSLSRHAFCKVLCIRTLLTLLTFWVLYILTL